MLKWNFHSPMSFSSPTGRQASWPTSPYALDQSVLFRASCREVSALAWISSVANQSPRKVTYDAVRLERKKKFRETWKQYATEKLEIYIRVFTRSHRACRVNYWNLNYRRKPSRLRVPFLLGDSGWADGWEGDQCTSEEKTMTW